MQKIIPISALKDNYIWIGVNEERGQAFAVDPGDAVPVLDYLVGHQLMLTDILVTHKHADHTAGLSELLNAFPDASVHAHRLEQNKLTTHFVEDNEELHLDVWPDNFKVLHIPGHTLGHVAFYTKSILFSGDTLFGAGCGRIFEGTAEQMFTSLNKLAALPDETLVYCGHEYTLANLKFALQVEPQNNDILQRIRLTEQCRANNKPSLPSTIGIEKKTNPFLRCMQESVVTGVENHLKRKLMSPVDVFWALREWKNTF